MTHQIVVYVPHCDICRPCWSPEMGSTWWRGVTRALSRWVSSPGVTTNSHWANVYSRSGELSTSRSSTRSPRVILELEVWLCRMTKSKDSVYGESSSFKSFSFQIPDGRTCYWVRCSFPHRLQQMASRISATILRREKVSIMFEPSMKVVKREKLHLTICIQTHFTCIILSMDLND